MHEANYMTIVMHAQNHPESLINVPEICRQQLNHTLKPQPSTPFSSSLHTTVDPPPPHPVYKEPKPHQKISLCDNGRIKLVTHGV